MARSGDPQARLEQRLLEALRDALAAGRPARSVVPTDEEREIRACAVHACELIAARLELPPRDLDVMLWNRGQASRYKARPRHRTRTVYY